MLDRYKIILWDFDGVIMNSMPIRSNGFGVVLKDYPGNQVEQLMEYHNLNGGLSRYVKFRYFFEQIRGESISEDKVLKLASAFSEIMLESLIDRELLIQDSISFIEENYTRYEMHIVSGSDGEELIKICEALNLKKYFKSINGSPTPKNELVRCVIANNSYDLNEIILIGDSINDYEAALSNAITFCGYNNTKLKSLGVHYLDSLQNNAS